MLDDYEIMPASGQMIVALRWTEGWTMYHVELCWTMLNQTNTIV